MTVGELCKRLSNQFSPDTEIMILDGFNGGGSPREINLVAEHLVTDQDAEDTADCEDKADVFVVVLGVGNY